MTEGISELLKQRMFQLPDPVSNLVPSSLLARDAPRGLERPDFRSANRHCRLLKARGGWVALNLARPDDRDMMPALVGETVAGDMWDAVSEAAGAEDVTTFRDRAIELQLPVALVGEVDPAPLKPVADCRVPARVVDMSVLWAGPLCAGLLAKCGAQVIRVESITRPDPTRIASPVLDRFLNGGKTRIDLDLTRQQGRDALLDMIRSADVLVTSSRPAALSGFGISEDGLADLAPGLLWLAITAHGCTGEAAHRVGFGDDCAAAGGLVDYVDDAPQFRGDALADPLTGLEGALAVLAACGAGSPGLIDLAMSRVAASYATGGRS